MKNNYNTPPRLAERILCWWIKDELAEEVLGDLDEKFYHNLKSKSTTRAKLNYWYQVLHYLRPFAIKNYRSNSIYYAMYKSYFKIGYRNLFKHKLISFINIGGLAMGMVVAMLTGLWIKDELSFNKYHKHYDKIAQVMFHSNWGGETMETNSSMTTGLGTLLKESYSNYFDKVAMVRARLEERVFTYGDRSFIEDGYYMQPEGAEIFSLEMIGGTIDGLSDLTTVFLSESLAKKIFNNEDPINKIIRFNEQVDLTVTGVYKDLPKNSLFHDAGYFVPLDIYLYGWSDLNVWDNFNMNIYVQLKDGIDPVQTSKDIKSVLHDHVDSENVYDLFLHPMKDWNLYSEFENGKQVTSDKVLFIWFYGLIGVFVLMLACVNFMNLSTARSEGRAKEIGIRKSMGSLRGQLLSQFLTESMLVSAAAFIIALLVIVLSLPTFNILAGKNMSLPLGQPYFWLIGIIFTILTGFVAGSYPAFYLSSFNPISSLKGTFKTGKYAAIPRKVLVVFQFVVSITLIIGTLMIYEQIQFVKNRPSGYLRDGLLMLPKRSSELFDKYDVIRDELLKTGVVTEIAEANYPLTNSLGNNGGFSWEGKDPSNNPSFNTIRVNRSYGQTVKWELLQGRGFSEDIKSDDKGVVITESARKRMGLDNPVGMTLTSTHDYWGSYEFTILGVVHDLIKGDPFKSEAAAIMFLSEEEMFWMFIRLKEGYGQAEALAKIDDVFRRISPTAYIDFKVVEDEYNTKFKAEERIGNIAALFASLAVIISCLGLFGLAAFLIEKRTKEIGIRKVLGASISKIWQLLTKDFFGLVIISSLISTPTAYYLIRRWLEQYEYGVEISPGVFIITIIGTLAITLLTVSYQAIKSATATPVDSLRSE